MVQSTALSILVDPSVISSQSTGTPLTRMAGLSYVHLLSKRCFFREPRKLDLTIWVQFRHQSPQPALSPLCNH